MSINIRSVFPLFIFCFIFLPNFLKAQSNTQGKENNHCVVKKSPFRLSMDSGMKVFSVQCLTCHQADGLGVPSMNPPLTGKRVMGDKSILIEIVIKGLATHEEIDGQTYQNVMPAHPDMNDKDIADVLTYIRNSFGNKASSVKVSDVKTVRSKLK